MGIVSIDLNNITFHDANFHENDPETTTHVRDLVWPNKFETRKACKQDTSKKIMFVA